MVLIINETKLLKIVIVVNGIFHLNALMWNRSTFEGCRLKCSGVDLFTNSICLHSSVQLRLRDLNARSEHICVMIGVHGRSKRMIEKKKKYKKFQQNNTKKKKKKMKGKFNFSLNCFFPCYIVSSSFVACSIHKTKLSNIIHQMVSIKYTAINCKRRRCLTIFSFQ